MRLLTRDGRRGKGRRLPSGWWVVSATGVYVVAIIYLTLARDSLPSASRVQESSAGGHTSEHREYSVLILTSDESRPAGAVT